MNRNRIPLWVAILALTLSSTAHATLISRLGGQAYYDTDSDLTWLADANANGLMDWATANSWATSLNVGGVTGWRLSETPQSDSTCGPQSGGVSYGFNCTGSDMGNLFYNVLGGVAGADIATTHNSNFNLFSNIVSANYWSATEYVTDPTSAAWVFGFGTGYQGVNFKGVDFNAWAVRSGDVGALLSDVPEPDALWLMITGLALIALRRRMTAYR